MNNLSGSRIYDAEETSILNTNFTASYSTLPTTKIPKSTTRYLADLRAYSQRLVNLLRYQFVVVLILDCLDCYLNGFRLNSLTNLIYWGYLNNIAMYTSNLRVLYNVRLLVFIITLLDSYNMYLILSYKMFVLPLPTVILTGLSIIFDVLIFMNSLLINGSIYELSNLAKVSKVYPSPEPYSTYFSILTFEWIQPLLDLGYNEDIEPEDIFDLRPDEKAFNLDDKFQTLNADFSFVYKLFSMFWKSYLIQFSFSILTLVFDFMAPLLLNEFLRLMEDGKPTIKLPFKLSNQEYGYILVLSMFAAVILKAICSSQSALYGMRIGTRVKSIIMSQVYAKTLKRRDISTEANFDTGKIINLMSSDASNISLILQEIKFIIVIPIQLIISIYLLYTVIGWSALVTVAFAVLVMPINKYIGSKYQEAHIALFKASDKRMSLINELLHGIRIVKLFAWEDEFRDRIRDARENELKQVLVEMLICVVLSVVYLCFPMLITFATFYTFTKIAGHILTPATTFTALVIFKILSGPIYMLPGGINMLIQSFVCLNRIKEFLALEEHISINVPSDSNSSADTFIGFKDATLSWGSEAFTLKDVNISFPPKKLSIIAGPTGSGKTSLLMGLLGEMPLIEGSAHLPFKSDLVDHVISGGVAYVAQTAWLQQDTIRNNILFGEAFDATRYQQVVTACALQPDFKLFKNGDMTEIGEKGITLSGGQKQRVALARAVYSNANHIVLDDCLSAVDAHTAKHLFNNCITGPLMKNRTRILVTHNMALTLNKADFIVALNSQGNVAIKGAYEEIKQHPEFQKELENYNKANEEPIKVNEAVQEDHITNLPTELTSEGVEKLVEEEIRAKGAITFDIYKCYFDATGGIKFWLGFILAFIVYQILPLILDLWIKKWAEVGTTTLNLSKLILFSEASSLKHTVLSTLSKTTAIPSDQLNWFIEIYLILMLVNALVAAAVESYGFYGSLKASHHIHYDLLENLLKAPIRFFDSTPVGRIVNRFGQDFQVVDQQLMNNAIIFLRETLVSIFVLLMIAYIIPQFLVAGVVIAFIFSKLTLYYIRGSRELKRIESTTRSPIFAHCDATIQGVATIRAFQHTSRFKATNYDNIDSNLRISFYLWIANMWLAIRSDFTGGLVTLFTGILLMTLRHHLGPSFMGLAFTYALNFSTHVLWIARFYANLEMDMNAMERIQEYMDMPTEPPAIIDGCRPPQNIKDLVLCYSSTHDPVIKGITININGGERVGIVGRTGAGKSTLGLALFRFLEAESGSIVIDNVNIATIGLKDLRSRLTVIPQDATLFSGTIRSNLDPFNLYDDAQLWKVLKQTFLIKDPDQSSTAMSTEANENEAITSLDQTVTENGKNFSHGQRQLLVLARALLKQSKVVLMDEDYNTDTKIQTTIRNSFTQCTLICIAHRLRTIIDYDRVIVLDKGVVVEYDSPKKLLQDEKSHFYGLCAKSNELEQLKLAVS